MNETATPTRSHAPRRYGREIALLLVPLLALAGIHMIPPIAQDPQYHALADSRALFGIRNFANVVSNLPFLIFGIVGFAWCLRNRITTWSAWATFFTGVALVSVASGYYHANPNDATLVWDRLPMTIAFMGLFVAIVSEHANENLCRYLLLPAVVIGLASLAWWSYADDLRFYIWVQTAPLLTIPLALLLFPARYTHRIYLLYGLAFYFLAKVVEFYDAPIYSVTDHLISGHSIKHVLASLSALCIYMMLRRRVLCAT